MAELLTMGHLLICIIEISWNYEVKINQIKTWAFITNSSIKEFNWLINVYKASRDV